MEPAIAPRGDLLAFVSRLSNYNLWRLDLNSPTVQGLNPVPLFHSTRNSSAAQFSPDGTRVAFESDREGTHEIWVADAVGRRLARFTHSGEAIPGTPRWSPDGALITYDMSDAGNLDIYVVPSGGGASRRLTSHRAEDVTPSWSRDGKWVYFASDRTGDFEIWKVRASEGEFGDAVQVTHGGGFCPLEGPDGKYLYYSRGRGKTGLLRIPTESDGAEEVVLASVKEWGWWVPARNGIYVLERLAGESGTRLLLYDQHSHRSRELFHWPLPVSFTGSEIAVSPDGRYVVCGQEESGGSDIMLLEGFR